MEITNTEYHTFRGEILGKVFHFENDTSVSVEINTGEIYDADGVFEASAEHIEAIEKAGTKVKTFN